MNRVRRLSEEVLAGHRSQFGGDFADNKKALSQVSVVRSKKLRNCMAGLITRLVKREARREKEREEAERAHAAKAKPAARETLAILSADVLHGPILDQVKGAKSEIAEAAAGSSHRISIPDTVREKLEVWMAAHSELRDSVPPSELHNILSAIFEGRKVFTRNRAGAAHVKKAEEIHKSALGDSDSEQASRWLDLKGGGGQDKEQELERLYAAAASDRDLLAAAIKHAESSRVLLVSGEGNLLAFKQRASDETDGALSIVDAGEFCKDARESPAPEPEPAEQDEA